MHKRLGLEHKNNSLCSAIWTFPLLFLSPWISATALGSPPKSNTYPHTLYRSPYLTEIIELVPHEIGSLVFPAVPPSGPTRPQLTSVIQWRVDAHQNGIQCCVGAALRSLHMCDYTPSTPRLSSLSIIHPRKTAAQPREPHTAKAAVMGRHLLVIRELYRPWKYSWQSFLVGNRGCLVGWSSYTGFMPFPWASTCHCIAHASSSL